MCRRGRGRGVDPDRRGELEFRRGADTGSPARVLQFASLSEELAPQTELTATSLQNGGLFRDALNDRYQPKPPRPSNVNIYQYDGGGNPQSSGNRRLNNGSNQYTNGDASLKQAVTVPPTVTGADFRWILPDGDPDAEVQTRCGNPSDPLDGLPRTCLTLGTGLVNFPWEPNPETATSTATVVEQPQQDFTPGRPGSDNDWTCNRKNDQGSLPSIGGELISDGAGGFTFDLDPFVISPQEIIACTIYDSYDYAREIALAKVDDPTEVRGDLTPPAVVTSTFFVTNPGHTPLTNIDVADDLCGTADGMEAGGVNVGDTISNGLLDTTASSDPDEAGSSPARARSRRRHRRTRTVASSRTPPSQRAMTREGSPSSDRPRRTRSRRSIRRSRSRSSCASSPRTVRGTRRPRRRTRRLRRALHLSGPEHRQHPARALRDGQRDVPVGRHVRAARPQRRRGGQR